MTLRNELRVLAYFAALSPAAGAIPPAAAAPSLADASFTRVAVNSSSVASRHTAALDPEATDGMLRLSGGLTRIADSMGKDPWGRAALDFHILPFYLDQHDVTVREWRAFLCDFESHKGYRYITVAEATGAGYVYDVATGVMSVAPGATWEHPDGAGTSPLSKDEPVTQIAVEDALMFASFYGKRLPTYPELQYAAYRGNALSRFPWGSQLQADRTPRANFSTPGIHDDDARRAPYYAYPSTPPGFFGLIGNVWKLSSTADWDGKVLTFGGGWETNGRTFDGRAWGKVSEWAPDNITGFRCAVDANGLGAIYFIDPTTQSRGTRRMVIDISDQRLYYYENGSLAMEAPVSTGIVRPDEAPGYRGGPTPTGSFRVLAKISNKVSMKYWKSPMPWSLHICGNIFVHGCVPEYIPDLGKALGTQGDCDIVGSRGCIRCHPNEARWLFHRIHEGDIVEVKR